MKHSLYIVEITNEKYIFLRGCICGNGSVFNVVYYNDLHEKQKLKFIIFGSILGLIFMFQYLILKDKQYPINISFLVIISAPFNSHATCREFYIPINTITKKISLWFNLWLLLHMLMVITVWFRVSLLYCPTNFQMDIIT